MADSLPKYYFRIRDTGATVFRIDTANRQRRMELEELGNIVLRNGNIRPRANVTLTPEDEAAMQEWLAQRQAELHRREQAEPRELVERLNLLAHWAQTRAEPAALAAVTDDLLLAMHDLRNILVRKKADRLAGGD